MKRWRAGWAIVAGGLLVAAALPLTAEAGQARARSGNAVQTQQQSGDRVQVRQRLRDGTGVNCPNTGSGAMQKRGNTYGPGDGTGNAGSGPKDGTGYGAPSQR